ncbi:putative DNA-binding transcriptional regulator AlpA [Phyllobacterium ifriqiyense]|uniref:DNA-binding transcriptional regulator AlpA n=1 Tax=Phyllobacterium ifriqiyense TaxID=314238 RepID=A0ABU0S8Y3_9HYPH|nr:hypothetical protein [Phyllobacterium ifriqiyense]MDQ0996936.1 putative DNA-binding transcriptional regulator AlpA [Phyllobacterium ifriqiyense]
MKTQRNEVLPSSLPPFGVSRVKAAALIDISESHFDKLVMAGKMPQPRMVQGRLIWDVMEVAEAFRALPHREGDLDLQSGLDNPWG